MKESIRKSSRFIVVACAFALAFALTACGGTSQSSAASSASASASSASASASSESASASSEAASSAAASSAAAKVPAQTGVEMQKISADDVLKAVEAKDDSMVIVDLRKAEDYKAGHIEGSVAATFQKAVEDGDYTEGYENIQAALKDADGKTVVLVCYTGNKYAQAATDTLNDLGYDMTKVFTLDGGAKGWSEAGKPMVTD